VRFQCEDEVGHPVAKVFALIRDDMPALVPYLNDVEEIVVVERKDEGEGRMRILNLWKGSSSKAPRVVRKFLSPDTLSWKDHALWHSDVPRRAEWRLEPKVGGSLFECLGTTSLIEKGPQSTLIRIEGNLDIYPERLPGVPRLLAGKSRGKIESFVVAMLVPNMQTMARGVQAYFDDQAASTA
jgi:nitrogen fixation protein